MLSCKIISPDQIAEFHGLRSISLTSIAGNLDILTNHAETFLQLPAGEISLRYRGRVDKKEISGGEGHFVDNQLVVVVVEEVIW